MGATEQAFVKVLNDHYLNQLNDMPTCGKNVFDLVITSAPSQASITEILSPDKAGLFTDYAIVLFQFNTFIKALAKNNRTVYDYNKSDFEGFKNAFQAINLSSVTDCEDLKSSWLAWKDHF